MLCIYFLISGEKLMDDEVDQLLVGMEDSQGQVNYEGRFSHVPSDSSHLKHKVIVSSTRCTCLV